MPDGVKARQCSVPAALRFHSVINHAVGIPRTQKLRSPGCSGREIEIYKRHCEQSGLAGAVSQYTDTRQNTEAALCCYALYSYVGTIFSHHQLLE